MFSQTIAQGPAGTLVLQHPERWWMAGAVMLLGVILLVTGYRGALISRGAKWAAGLCKLGAWALLALCLLEPMLTSEVPRKGANEVTLLADASASMSVAEKTGGKKRSEMLIEALQSAEKPGGWMEKLAEQFRVRQMTFGTRMSSVDAFTGMTFAQPGSDLCSSLKSLQERSQNSALAAIVVFTDGSATDASAWATLPEKKAPVFPVMIGDSAPERDLSLMEVVVSQSAFEDSPVMLTAKVSAPGHAGAEVAVCALDAAGKIAATEKHRFSEKETAHVYRLRLTAVKPGVSFHRVMVVDAAMLKDVESGNWRKLGREATLENNERLITVDRGAGPYRVLYVSGRPNWEHKFLKRALAADPEVQLPGLIRIAKREPKFEWRGRTGETSNPLFRGFNANGGDEAQRYDQPVMIRVGMKDAKELADGFPKAAEQLFGEYRAIILDDVEAGFFTQEQMNLIERFVSHRGGSLLMLGGQECFQQGGYEHTPVGRMLPVYLDRLSTSAPVSAGRLNLTREGWLEPWTRLRAQQEEDATRLSVMPGFHVVNQTTGIKPGASILATVSDADRKAHPALVVQRFGEGRVAALTIGDMWRWGMADATQHADMDKAWRQLVRALVADVPGRVTLEVADTALKDGRILQVRARTADYRAMDDAVVRLHITGPDGRRSELFAEPSLKEPGVFEAEHFSSEAGGYRAEAEVRDVDGKVIGAETAGWSANPLADEFAALAPGRELLERIAKETGGRMLSLDDVKRLPELLANLNVPVKETLTEPLWHSPWIFTAILGLLAAEWILRRKGGWL